MDEKKNKLGHRHMNCGLWKQNIFRAIKKNTLKRYKLQTDMPNENIWKNFTFQAHCAFE